MSITQESQIDALNLQKFVAEKWDEEIVPCLTDYIRIPCKSPHFDEEWSKHGYIDDAVELALQWARQQNVEGISLEVIRLENRTPVLFFEISGDLPSTILMYGHLDKQPEMMGWEEGLGPWSPVIRDGKLYGRGGADDGYAIFASIAAISSLQRQGIKIPRTVGIIECCEESGSYDLPFYLEHLRTRIRNVDFVIGLDSGCGNYDQLWGTTSLRGMAAGTLTVEILKEGVHSGDASGVVPSSYRIIRNILERIEDSRDGRIIPSDFWADIPEERKEQARLAGEVLGDTLTNRFPFVRDAKAMSADYGELVLNRTWRPYLSVIGSDHVPPVRDAGNVLRPKTALKLSLRLPPTIDGDYASRKLKQILESDPPYGASVKFELDQSATGWHAPPTADWLAHALHEASESVFSRNAVLMGEGGTIPFMAMLGEYFPNAQFLITGVLGPKSNAHGPNEFLHIPYGKKLTECVAKIIEQFSLNFEHAS